MGYGASERKFREKTVAGITKRAFPIPYAAGFGSLKLALVLKQKSPTSIPDLFIWKSPRSSGFRA